MNDPNKKYSPESLMMSYGYSPESCFGAVKCPEFQTSTFAFKTAEEGKAFFELAYGLRDPQPNEKMGMIYSRLNNPNLEILEKRLTLWDKAEDAAVFESGMAAITTALFEFLKPGDLLLYSGPLYGGTTHFIESILPEYGIKIMSFNTNEHPDNVVDKLIDMEMDDKLAMIFIETPANPTLGLVDIEMYSKIAKAFSNDEKKVMLAVDNTFLGPVFQHPLKHGADLVLYSATKYIGGHSDVVAGACLGTKENIQRIKGMRTFLGNMASPHTAWLLMRSLETLKIRMKKQAKNAKKVAAFLKDHPLVEKVYFLGDIDSLDYGQQDIFRKQCEAGGAMISFDIAGGEKEAFNFLNNLHLIKMAVSLGGTESLAEHPATMTHAGMDKEQLQELNITEKLVRLSIGVENYRDLIADLDQALDKATVPGRMELYQ